MIEMLPIVAADLPPANVPYGDARLGVLVARRQWPNNPCNGHEQVLVSRNRPPDPSVSPEQIAGTEFVGWAYLAGHRCQIWVRAWMSREMTCKAVVHEEGHWALGPDHTDTGIMSTPADDADYPPCTVPTMPQAVPARQNRPIDHTPSRSRIASVLATVLSSVHVTDRDPWL